MCQSEPVYANSPALQLLDPWMRARLPKIVDQTARRRLIQLTSGIFETHSALIETIATGTAFQANTESSNETQVRRILYDERIHLAAVYYPFIRCLLEEMPANVDARTRSRATSEAQINHDHTTTMPEKYHQTRNCGVQASSQKEAAIDLIQATRTTRTGI